MEQCRKLNFIQHIQIIIAGCTICSESDTDTFCQETRNRCRSTREFHIAAGIVRNANMILLDDINILIVQMNTMCGKCTVKKQSRGCNVRKGAFSVLLDAVLHLAHRLRHMDVNFCTKRLCLCSNLL